MNRVITIATFVGLGFALSLATGPASALPCVCAAKCHSETPDSIVCVCERVFPTEVITCGDFRNGACSPFLTGGEKDDLAAFGAAAFGANAFGGQDPEFVDHTGAPCSSGDVSTGGEVESLETETSGAAPEAAAEEGFPAPKAATSVQAVH